MSRSETVRRYIIFAAGLLLNAFGVAFVTKATLGTSPIASIPYSLSLILPTLSLGNWVISFNVLLVLLQWVILRKDAKKVELLLQVVITVFFGYFIDLSMLCLGAFYPSHYALKLVSLVLGCAIIAVGAYLELVANVVMLPADAFVRAVARVTHKEYGTVRVISDSAMTLIACALCLVFLRKLSGVREGTVIAALITGSMVKLFTRAFKPLTRALLGKYAEQETAK